MKYDWMISASIPELRAKLKELSAGYEGLEGYVDIDALTRTELIEDILFFLQCR